MADFVKLGALPKTVPGRIRADVGAHFRSYKKRFVQEVGQAVSAMAVDSSEQTERVLVASSTRVILLSLTEAGFSETQQFTRHKAPVTALGWRGDGKLFASGDASGSVLVSSPSLGVLRRLKGHEGPVTGLLFAGEKIFTSGKDGQILVWDAATGQQTGVALQGRHRDAITKMALSPDSQFLLSSSLDGDLRVWSLESGNCEKIFSHGDQIDVFALFPGAGLVALTFGGSAAKMWSVHGQGVAPVAVSGLCHARAVTGAAVLATGDAFVTVASDGSAKIRASADLAVLHTWSDFQGGVVDVAVAGKKIFFVDETGRVSLRERKLEEAGDGADAAPESVSTENVYIVGKPGKVESHIDFMLRKFEYRKVGQMLISTESGLTHLQSLAAVDELMQREALHAAVKDFTAEQMQTALDWAARSLTSHPEHTGLVAAFAQALCQENAATLRHAALAQNILKLRNRVDLEVHVINKLAPLLGTIQTLMLA